MLGLSRTQWIPLPQEDAEHRQLLHWLLEEGLSRPEDFQDAMACPSHPWP